MSCCPRCDWNDREERAMLDDQLLDARDMAEEIAEAKGELTTCKHDGMRKPCIFGCDERDFNAVLSEWWEACQVENAKLPVRRAEDLAVVEYAAPLITRLTLLGNRLLQEANDLGMRQVMGETTERLKQ